MIQRRSFLTWLGAVFAAPAVVPVARAAGLIPEVQPFPAPSLYNNNWLTNGAKLGRTIRIRLPNDFKVIDTFDFTTAKRSPATHGASVALKD